VATKLRVVVADEKPLMRAGVAALLTHEPDIDVIAEVGTGEDAVASAKEFSPDVMVIDILMTGGFAATRAVVELGVSVFVLAGHQLDLSGYSALRAGASGLLLRDAAPTELVDAIRTVAAGGGWLDPTVTRELLREFAGRAEPGARTPQELHQLTNREREVLSLMAHGFSNKEIAKRLLIREGTVKSHVGRVLTKLQLQDRAQAVAFAYQSGLIVVPPKT
jgi:DNA-binding NarL/FixJ family response regulator